MGKYPFVTQTDHLFEVGNFYGVALNYFVFFYYLMCF